jgi:5'-phosphate synthase pdxT subunit
MKVGILALQGAVEHHQQKLAKLGTVPVLVRRPEHLSGLAAIILPGGESSTMLKLLNRNELFQPLKEFCQRQPTWGLCAGAILLAKTVSHPSQSSLGLMDIHAVRNAYGRQLESFICNLESTTPSSWRGSVEGVFIRAPRLEVTDPVTVETLFCWQNEAVMVKQGHLLAASFHPELSAQDTLHSYFLDQVRQHL